MTFRAPLYSFMNERNRRKKNKTATVLNEYKKEMFRSWKATKPVSFLKTCSSQSRRVHIRKMKTIQLFVATPQPWNDSSHSIARCPMTKEKQNYFEFISVHHRHHPKCGKFRHDIVNNFAKMTKPKPIITNAHGKSIKAQLRCLWIMTRLFVCFDFFFDRSLLFWLQIIIISDWRLNLCLFSLWMFSTARRTLNWSLFKVLCLLNFVFSFPEKWNADCESSESRR